MQILAVYHEIAHEYQVLVHHEEQTLLYLHYKKMAPFRIAIPRKH